MPGPTRRSLLKTGAAAAAAQAQPAPRPNILFVVSDDHSFPHAGCYGDRVIRTPRIDAFAAEGMRFDRAYTTAPQCSPSRASMMTGQAPQRVNMTRLHATLPPEHLTFFEYLKQAGYYTGISGRTHHMDGLLAHRPWFKEFYARHGLQTMKNRVDVMHSGSQEDGIGTLDRFLQDRPKDRPFAMQVNLSDPHAPWTAVDQEKLYRAEDIKIPRHYPDTLEMRKRFIQYYAEVSHADQDFGRILDILDRRGLKENTVVFFMGDNGYSFPFGKVTLYQAGWHVPLIARWPGRMKAGTSSAALVSGTDIFATFLSVGGAAVPAGVEGRSIQPLWTSSSVIRQHVFCARGWHDTFDMGRAVCSNTHSLIYNVWPEYKGARLPQGFDVEKEVAEGRFDGRAAAKWKAVSRPMYELYDLRNDPLELTNLAGKPATASTQRELMAALSEWMEVSRDFVPPPFLNSTELDADPLHRGPSLR